MKCHFVIVLMLLALVMPVVAQKVYPKIIECEVPSQVLGSSKKCCVYLPAGYSDVECKFPVLYLLHGLTDTHTAWRDKGNVVDIAKEAVSSGTACEMVIVMPDAGTTYDGYFNIDGWRYEDFFFQELIPYIESEFRVIADRQHRAVAGLSMGGGGATGYAIRHSDMFSSVYAMSALMGMVENSWISHNADDRRSVFMRSVIENNNIELVRNATVEQCKEIASLRWFIDVGDDDFLFFNNMDFVRAMREKRIPYQLRVRDGAHTWQYWQDALRMALPFVSEGFGSK